MNILILGSGGREHSLAWAVAQNPKCDRLMVAPGNAGIAKIADCVALDILDGALRIYPSMHRQFGFPDTWRHHPARLDEPRSNQAIGNIRIGQNSQWGAHGAACIPEHAY